VQKIDPGRSTNHVQMNGTMVPVAAGILSAVDGWFLNLPGRAWTYWMADDCLMSAAGRRRKAIHSGMAKGLLKE
jgi:hypothetical protein